MTKEPEKKEPKVEEQPISYTQIPVFGRLGKIFVSAAPDGSGRNAQAYAPIQSGSSASSSPTASGGGGGGLSGGGGPSSTGIPPETADYGPLQVEICIDGVVKSYKILAKEVT